MLGKVSGDPTWAGKVPADPTGAEKVPRDPIDAGKVSRDPTGAGKVPPDPTGAGKVPPDPTGAGKSTQRSNWCWKSTWRSSAGKVPGDPVQGKYPEIQGIINQSELGLTFNLDCALCKVSLQIFMNKMYIYCIHNLLSQ